MLKPTLLWVYLLFVAAPATAPSGKTLRVYHIGNSVTDTIHYAGLQQLAAANGDTYLFGRHMMPGTPLFGLWDNQDKGFTEQPYGASVNALKNFEWDVITLQPYDRLLEGDRESDFETCSRFVHLALQKSPDVQGYIYQHWPKRPIIGKPRYDGTDRCEQIDYLALWEGKYSGGWGNTIETRDYFDRLVAKLNATFGERLRRPIKVVPVGEVMAELERAIRGGGVEGLKSINDLYADNVHLNAAGRYLVGLTFYATMFGRGVSDAEPIGYADVDPALAVAIRQAVARVVR